MEDLQSTNNHSNNLQPIARQRQWHQSFSNSNGNYHVPICCYNSNYHAINKQNSLIYVTSYSLQLQLQLPRTKTIKIVYYTIPVIDCQHKLLGPIGIRGQMIIFNLQFVSWLFSLRFWFSSSFSNLSLRDNNLLVTFVTTMSILS